MTNTHPRILLLVILGGIGMILAGCPAAHEATGAPKAQPAAPEQPSTEPPMSREAPPSAQPQAVAVKANAPDVQADSSDVAKTESPAKPATRLAPKESADPNPRKTVDRPRVAKNLGEPFDPIKQNGPIFLEDGRPWPKPKLALVVTGMERGYIEPCGCAGLDRMKGGMTRRHTFFQELRGKGWPVVALDVGGLAHGYGRQAEMKFQTLVEGKRKMGYDAIAFGIDDLRLPAAELVLAAAGVDGKPGFFVAANVALFGFDAGLTPTHKLIEAGGVKLGVTAVLGQRYRKEITDPDIETTDPEQAVEKVLPALKAAKPDYLVLLAHATMEECIALARRFPEFNAVVASDGPPEPPAAPQTIDGLQTLLITVGQEGRNAIVLGLMDDAAQPIRYQRVPLDSRFPPSPDMKLLMTAYQDQLKTIGFAGLGLRPAPHPLKESNGRFVGSDKCYACHEPSNDIWKKSLHARAYETLEKLDPPRNHDPECISCHVVGWDPMKFFPYESGFESKEITPKLIGVGCESCHGPGEKHCEVELSGSEEAKLKYRKAVVVTKEESEKRQCMTCHDGINSPDFDFEKYWPFVKHYETEE